jgi:hypothetical protein
MQFFLRTWCAIRIRSTQRSFHRLDLEARIDKINSIVMAIALISVVVTVIWLRVFLFVLAEQTCYARLNEEDSSIRVLRESVCEQA